MRKSSLTKYIFVILFACLLCVLNNNSTIANAAGINSNESEVISVAKGIFELSGIKYQVDPIFTQQLTDYLNQEGVDINASQKEEIIGTMFSNVEQGIAEGYLIPLPEQEVENSEEVDTESTPDDNIGSGNEEDKPEVTTGEEIENEPEKDYSTVINEIRKQPTTKTEVDQNKNRVIVTKEDNSNVLVVNTVIKNTGYNLTPVLITISVFVLITIICLLITIKYNFFKQEDQ